jgi:hypothetical protein
MPCSRTSSASCRSARARETSSVPTRRSPLPTRRRYLGGDTRRADAVKPLSPAELPRSALPVLVADSADVLNGEPVHCGDLFLMPARVRRHRRGLP